MTPISPDDRPAVLALMRDAARQAGDLAMSFFREGAETAAQIDYKPGGSPVTEADLAVDRYLEDRLRTAIPEAAWLSEETADDLSRLDHDHVLVVDPIDGTRSYAAGDPHWAVSIALVSRGRPVVGVLAAPALGHLYEAVEGGGAFRGDAPIAPSAQSGLEAARISAPAGFIRPLARAYPIVLVPRIPSLACRFAAVAAGDIDGAVASPDAHDWDIAAVDVILQEAGAGIAGADGLPLRYNGRSPRHRTLYAAGPALRPALIAAGRRTLGGGG